MGSKNLRLAELATNVDASGNYTGGGSVQVYTATSDFPASGNTAGDLAFADSSNLLYIYDGVGWYNIALVNQSPTITSGGAGSYDLAQDGTPTIITLVANDPDGFPITWSYVTSGLDSEATITQGTGDSANIFTITPSTDTAKAGSFTVTFKASDGINIATDVNEFTLVFGDTYFSDVVTLMQTDKDPYTLDASSNSLAITENGDVKPTSFSPYRGSYYSASFPATSAYLYYSPAGSDSFGTGDFTVECWYYPNEVTASDIMMPSATTNTWSLLTYNNQLYWKENGSNLGGTGYGTVVKSAWNHLVVARSGTTLKMFINGTEVHSVTNSFNYSGAPSTRSVGPNAGGSAPYFLSNVRIVKGTALYTADFTPPTSPLTTTSQGATASEVELLCCQSNRFIDNSSNGYTLTVAGSPAVSGHVPFAAGTTYATYGSAYFDGSGDYLSIVDNSMTAAGEFTIEGWFYSTSALSSQNIFHWSDLSDGFDNDLILETSGAITCRVGSGGNTKTTSSTGLWSPNTWYHFAVVRNSSNNVDVYLNGVHIIDHGVRTDDMDNTLEIGRNPYSGGISYFYGYLSNLRIVKGTALYTSSFTPPTSPLQSVTNTSILTLQNNYAADNYTVVDKSGGEMPLTVYGDTNVTSFTPYSPKGHSVYFDGTGDYLSVPNDAGFQFGTGDFTVECWINKPAAVNGSVVDVRSNGTGAVPWAFYVDGSNFPYFYDGTSYTSTVSIVNNAWNHIAVTRSSGVLKIFVNGVQGYSASHTVSLNATGSLLVGGVAAYATGYISNLRIVKGTALYTSNFTPSTTALTPTTKTSLLTCQSPSFIDNSPYRHTITRNGDARVTAFSPFAGSTMTPTTYSMIMNAHTDIATVESNTFDMSGEFTLEAWIFPTNTPSQNWGIIDARVSGATNAYWIWSLKNSSGSLYVQLYAASGAGSVIQGSTAINLNEWTHVALTRNSSNTITIWVNGVSDTTTTASTDYTVTSSAQIGSTKDAGDGTYESNGCISNLRLVTGSCLYTTAFTPSTTALTAVSGTQLLTCQDSTLKDNSSNGLAITTSTSTAARPSEFNPFGYTTTEKVEYSPITHGGSMYGDGTTDYVDVPANAFNSLGTSDFCIQFWTYTKEIDANKGQIAIGGNKISIRFDSSNRMTFWVAGNGGPTSTPNNTVYPFNWYHVCLERSGSTNTLYINGVAKASNTTTPSNDATPLIRIGGQYGDNTGYTFTGWIGDLRIQSKAVYKGNFLPPKQIEYVSDAKLQVPFSDAAVYDSTGAVMLDINSLTTSTSVSKFNNQSLKFAGVSDFVESEERHGTTKVYADQLELGQSDFTIEFWVNFTSLSGRQDLLWIGSSGTRLGILYNLTSTHLTYYNSSTGAISANPSFSTDTWYHIALSRASGSTKLFVDGTQLGSTYVDSINYDGTILYLGKDSSASSSYFNGYMDGLRITKYARYTSNFTAPSGTFKAK